MKTVLAWLKPIGALILLIAVGEIPLVRDFSHWIDVNRPWLLPATIGTTVAGLLMLLFGFVIVGIKYGQPMSDAELDQLSAETQVLGPGKRYSKARFKGWRRGRKVDPPVEWSSKEMKDAWHASAWWSDPDMRQKYFTTVGGTMLILSVFLLFMVVFKPYR